MNAPAPRAAGSIDLALRGTVGTFAVEAAFAAPAGEVTAIFGPSGSGKTTVLRAVAGLARLGGQLQAGASIWQDDSRGIFLAPHRRRVGFAFQEPALFDHLSIEGNLRYAERRAAAARRNRPLSFSEVVERLGLASQLDRTPRGLSGGERQRVSLARALLSDPVALLLDEPLSALHRKARDTVLPWLRSLAEEAGMAVLYVSHDLGEVVEIAHRIALMSGGRIAAAAPASESLERLEADDAFSRFETSTILTARVRSHLPALGLSELDLDGQILRVPGTRYEVGAVARLRVRARDIALATKPPEAISIRNVLRGTIGTIAEHAESPFAEILVEIGRQRLRARITRDAVADLGLEGGSEVFALLKSVSLDAP